MKTSMKPGVLIFLSLSIGLVSCHNKSYVGTQSPTLVLSKSVLKIGEPLLVTTKGQTLGSNVLHWSVTPNAGIWVSSTRDSATFLFTDPGNYQISATFNSGTSLPYDSTQSTLTVSDSLYSSDTSNVAHCNNLVSKPILSDDVITLTPIAFSDSAGLVLMANTQILYDYYPVLSISGNFTGQGGTYEADFNAVIENPCSGYNLQGPSTTDVFFSVVNNGTYDLVCTRNGTTYRGNMTVTGTNCTFTWNYTSGIVISPLQIQKR